MSRQSVSLALAASVAAALAIAYTNSRVGQRSACGQGELLRHLIEGPQRLRRWCSQLRGHVEDQLQSLRFQIRARRHLHLD